MTETTPINLTDAAARRIKKIILAENKPDLLVRLEVLGGGCSGYQYKFGFDTTASKDEDCVIEHDGAKLVVDLTSLELLKGCEIDYSESLMEAGFKVKNPNATSSCGCGTSFAI